MLRIIKNKLRSNFNKTYNYLGSFSDYHEAVKTRKSAEMAFDILKDLGATDIKVEKSKYYNSQNISAIIIKTGCEPLLVTIQGASNES